MGLFGHFLLHHRLHSCCYAPSSAIETVSEIPHKQLRQTFQDSFKRKPNKTVR